MSAKLKLLFAMVIFGTIGVFVRFILLPSQETAFYRALIAFVLLFAVRLLTQKEKKQALTKKQLLLLFCSGAALGLNWVFLFEAYRYTSLSLATLTYYFAPVIVMLLSPLLFREKTTRTQWICLLFSIGGLLLILASKDTLSGQNHTTGIICGFSAAVFYAIVILMNKSMHDLQSFDRTIFQFLFSIFILLPYVFFTGGFHITSLSGGGLLALLVLGLVHTGLAYVLYFSSLASVSGQEAALFSYVDPAITIFISIFFLHEPTSFLQILGGVCILGATLFHELYSLSKKANG